MESSALSRRVYQPKKESLQEDQRHVNENLSFIFLFEWSWVRGSALMGFCSVLLHSFLLHFGSNYGVYIRHELKHRRLQIVHSPGELSMCLPTQVRSLLVTFFDVYV